MIYRCSRARHATTSDPADAWHWLLCAIVERAIRDARRKHRPSLEARQFLMEPAPTQLMLAIGLDPAAVRERAVAEWCRGQGG